MKYSGKRSNQREKTKLKIFTFFKSNKTIVHSKLQIQPKVMSGNMPLNACARKTKVMGFKNRDENHWLLGQGQIPYHDI